jgi:alkyl hydroperoxide reductase subunit AhpC
VIAVGTSNVDSVIPWAEQQINSSYPVGGDFWPHGQVALQYGLLRPDGVADRAMFLIDRAERIRFKELYSIHQIPPVEPVMEALRQLSHKEQSSI